MSTVMDLVFAVGYGLLAVAFLSSIFGTFQRRDLARLDVAFFVGVLLVYPLVRPQGVPAVQALRVFSVTLLAYGLVRLTRHFRDAPKLFDRLTLLAAVVSLPFAWFLPSVGAIRTIGVITGYVATVMAFAAVVFFSEGRRCHGIKKRRLILAAIATALLAANYSLVSLGSWFLGVRVQGGPLLALFQGLSLFCYYFAFGTPRFLLSRWRRVEQSNYLAKTSEREPEERGRKAADDLFQASVRTVGGGVTFVATKSAPGASDLVIRASNAHMLIGLKIDHEEGLIGRTIATQQAQSGAFGELEPSLAARLRALGGQVLVAPIATTAHLWGVIFVMHRRGALFPEDDLAMLGQLGRTAATALEHAHLVVERRERERQIADRRLRELETRVGLMLDSIKDYAMLLVDDTGRVAAWHLGAQHLFGYRSEQVTDRSAASIYDMAPSEFGEWLSEARLRGHAERESTCRRYDGSTFVGTTIIRPLVNEPDEPPGFVAVTRDVTERRALEDRLRQGQKMEAIGQLAGGVAHDFNNLLTAILGYADWLDRDLRDDPRRDQVTEIQKAAERAADLTRQLLAFSRRQMLQLSILDLGPLIADLLPMLRRLIGEQIEVIDATSAQAIPVRGDRSQIEQIVLNLSLNARDAMPGGGRLTIRTDAVSIQHHPRVADVPAGDYVLLEVSDTGEGMDAETQRRAFEPFFTTKEVGRGTGLGLSTVYGIVQQMNGAIDIQSEIGRGTTFRLYFPRGGAVTSTASPANTTDAWRGHETVLLVEDDEAVRTYLASILDSHGYAVLAAEHPRAALAQAEAAGGRIDLVISDVIMPGSTGPELVRLLGEVHPGLTALFISGYSENEMGLAGHAAAGGQLLQKPFSSAEFLTKVREILSAA